MKSRLSCKDGPRRPTPWQPLRTQRLLSFPGWSLVTVVPESEFLGPVQMTIRNLLIGLAVLIVFAGLLSAWLAQRWDDPAFPAAFPWFNTQRYWQDRILELREQVALMDEPPLQSG